MVADGRRRERRLGGPVVSRRLVIPDTLRKMQSQASNPKASAWVSANAGSGKTHVLTQRVLRLLLAGTSPGQILGLTFTKAAAANMATRIFNTLALWASLSDEALGAAIVETGAEKPSPQDLVFARQLFARTIETPGGLRIQTLHAFCERLLHLFPFEANVPAHFRVIDEREAGALIEEARDEAIASARNSSVWKELERVSRDAGAFKFDDLLRETQAFAETFAAFDDAREFAAALRGPLGLANGETTGSVEAEMFGGGIGRRRRQDWARGLGAGKKSDREFAAKLREVDGDGALDARIGALLEAFFTKGGEGDPFKGDLTTKALQRNVPELEADLHREQDRLIALRDRRRAALIVERSEALFAVGRAVLMAFADAKARRGELDFADQIAGALRLVTRSSAAWVLRKLDARLDHLLIDEAQDTSPEQWRILVALSAELFAGQGARTGRRTIFAVGDEKQSIFSFQGAAPELFAKMRRFFEQRHRDAELRFESVPLNFSFRSAPAILKAVDKTFGEQEAWRGVGAAGEPSPQHEAVRSAMKGVVELWPTIKPAPAADPEDWRMPLDELSRDEPAATLACRIAKTIEKWLSPESRERVADHDGAPRRIRPGDVMILVRIRNGFFDAMIRALKDHKVKVAGADRLMLRDHIAVMDLVAVGRAALAPDDDLTLACVLKSPLVGLKEDDLFALAANRGGSLGRALAASPDERARNAARRLAIWRARAGAVSPHTFYTLLLGEDGGRKALLGRLGPDAADPTDEFLALALAHEQRAAPSLHRFLAEVEAADTAIKRDMESESEGVRVLTVHASKGLEAPIVFLPDTCGAPDGRHDPKLLRLAAAGPNGPPLFAWSRKKDDDCRAMADARAERREAEAGEHRRLLYVAMTRAAQRLVVAGYETSTGRSKGCWYDLVESGLRESMTDSPAPWSGGETIRRFGESLFADDLGETPLPLASALLPAWLSAKAAPDAPPAPLRPSRLGLMRESERVNEGRLAHALLQMLPDVAPERRAAAAKAYLDTLGGALGAAARVTLSAQVLSVIEAPELAALFGPGSRGEVSLAGVLRRPGRADAPYSGRLDRLLVTGGAASIVDFKLGAAPTAPSPAHLAQLAVYRAALQAIYPTLPVRAALVYIDGPTLRPIETGELDAALDAVDDA
ncbi:MAG: double-strand break repair helicase AddA [Hyphomicrobiales bacterium]|nr:double-strand break repair helicase AddA [Hyphomicrobiales bacterium]